MNDKNLSEAMSDLAQLDIDAVHACDQAVREVDDNIIQDRLLKFQDEHRQPIIGLFQADRNARRYDAGTLSGS